jgi:hypothetical protein
MVGAPWYGDDIMLDRWWPVALDLWRSALAARADRAYSGVSSRNFNSASILRPPHSGSERR